MQNIIFNIFLRININLNDEIRVIHSHENTFMFENYIKNQAYKMYSDYKADNNLNIRKGSDLYDEYLSEFLFFFKNKASIL